MTQHSEQGRPAEIQKIVDTVTAKHADHADVLTVSLDKAVTVFLARARDPGTPLDVLEELPDVLVEPVAGSIDSPISLVRRAVETGVKRGWFSKGRTIYEERPVEEVVVVEPAAETVAEPINQPKPLEERRRRSTAKRKRTSPRKGPAAEKQPAEKKASKKTVEKKTPRRRRGTAKPKGFVMPEGYGAVFALAAEYDISVYALRDAVVNLEGRRVAGRHGVIVPLGPATEIARALQQKKKERQSTTAVNRVAKEAERRRGAERRARREAKVAAKPDLTGFVSKRSLSMEYDIPLTTLTVILAGAPAKPISQGSDRVRFEKAEAVKRIKAYKKLPEVDAETGVYVDRRRTRWAHVKTAERLLHISLKRFAEISDGVRQKKVKTRDGKVHMAYDLDALERRLKEQKTTPKNKDRISRKEIEAQYPDMAPAMISQLLRDAAAGMDIKNEGRRLLYKPDEVANVIDAYRTRKDNPPEERAVVDGVSYVSYDQLIQDGAGYSAFTLQLLFAANNVPVKRNIGPNKAKKMFREDTAWALIKKKKASTPARTPKPDRAPQPDPARWSTVGRLSTDFDRPRDMVVGLVGDVPTMEVNGLTYYDRTVAAPILADTPKPLGGYRYEYKGRVWVLQGTLAARHKTGHSTVASRLSGLETITVGESVAYPETEADGRLGSVPVADKATGVYTDPEGAQWAPANVIGRIRGIADNTALKMVRGKPSMEVRARNGRILRFYRVDDVEG